MSLGIFKNKNMRLSRVLFPAEPLWKRLPVQEHHGTKLSDFMMVIPGLKLKPPEVICSIVDDIEKVLMSYEKYVIFADLNLKINVLWVTIQPIAGLSMEVAAAIHHCVPEAKVVAHKLHQ